MLGVAGDVDLGMPDEAGQCAGDEGAGRGSKKLRTFVAEPPMLWRARRDSGRAPRRTAQVRRRRTGKGGILVRAPIFEE